MKELRPTGAMSDARTDPRSSGASSHRLEKSHPLSVAALSSPCRREASAAPFPWVTAVSSRQLSGRALCGALGSAPERAT